MKELSIEEKAKRYDETIEIAKEINNERQAQPFNVMTKVFPELAESEDEKIRKAIYNCVKWFGFDSIHFKYVSQENCLAWLEKQGKNNMGISEATKKKLEDNLNKALEKETPESWNEFLEKQAEQKSVEWSEEDENRLNSCISILNTSDGFETLNSKWLKSLKDRVQPQTKQEWSEEDCNQIETIACHLDNIGNGAMAESLLNIMDKYKSLRPQSQWKPSEEQIISIKWMLQNVPYNIHKQNLADLFEQLKAL